MKLFLLFIFICGARAKVEDTCLSNPCQNDGTCLINDLDGENEYYCVCNEGFSGKNCEIVDEPCLRNPCQNGGSCLEDGSAYKCICRDGYTGKQCERVDPCRNQPCQNDGYCWSIKDKYICDCTEGYLGENCETVDPCRSQPCQNDGYCSTYNDEYKCDCRTGFSGKNCETVVTSSTTTARLFRTSDQSTLNTDSTEASRYSSQFPMSTGGPYSTEAGRYSSQFPMSTGDPFNPCQSYPCQNGGYCWSIRDKYICDCTEGFTGKSCEKIEKYSATTTRFFGTSGHGNRHPYSTEAGRYSSQFPLSTGDPYSTEAGRYSSQFPLSTRVPYASSKQHFFSTDEAFTKSPFASTYVFQTTSDCRCENGFCTVDIYGNLKCVCHPQYAKIDGGRCTPCDCGQEAHCEFVREGGRVRKHCFCPMGYEESNGRCTDIDECIHTRHCPQNTECQNTKGSYDCVCSEGYRPYNKSSEVKADGCIEVCSSNTCINGQCKIDDYSYFCKCDNGFTGRYCEEKIDNNRIMEIIEIQSPWIILSALLLIIFLAFIFIHRNKSVKRNTFVFSSSDDKCPLFEDRKNERIGETGENSKQCSILQKKSPV